jgi:hypothetical protein
MYCDGCAKSEDLAVKAELENLALRAEISNARQVIDGLLAYKTQAAERHQKDLDEIAELKRKLAEAEKACPCSGGGHTLTKCPYFRAEAAERELNEKHARLVEVADKKKAAERERNGLLAQREIDLAQFKKTMLGITDMIEPVIAAKIAAERKCAELSEALRKASFSLRHNVHLGADAQIALADILDAALASQPAPEAKGCNEVDSDGTCCHTPHCGDKPKPEMSAEVTSKLAFAETHKCIMGPPCDKCAALEILAAEVRRLHKLTTPDGGVQYDLLRSADGPGGCASSYGLCEPAAKPETKEDI